MTDTKKPTFTANSAARVTPELVTSLSITQLVDLLSYNTGRPETIRAAAIRLSEHECRSLDEARALLDFVWFGLVGTGKDPYRRERSLAMIQATEFLAAMSAQQDKVAA